MKGLILCAGHGLGLLPFTLRRPKSLVPVANKPILHYSIHQLLGANINDIGIVIGPKGDDIKNIINDYNFPTLYPTFLTQQKPAGIAAAVAEASDFIGKEPFVLLLGDNIFAENLSVLTEKFDRASTDAVILVTCVEKPERFGVAVFNGARVNKVIEKPKIPVSNWAITGAYVFGPAIFSAIANITPSWRGELEITDAIQWLIANNKNVIPVKTDKWWADAGSLENLLKANRYLLEKANPPISLGEDCTISNCQLIPPLIVGDRCTLINATVGPYASIGSDSKLTNVLINNSMLMNNVSLTNIQPIVCHSIIGSNVDISHVNTSGDLKLILGDYCKFTCLT